MPLTLPRKQYTPLGTSSDASKSGEVMNISPNATRSEPVLDHQSPRHLTTRSATDGAEPPPQATKFEAIAAGAERTRALDTGKAGGRDHSRELSPFRYRLLNGVVGEVPQSLINSVPQSTLALCSGQRWAQQTDADGRYTLLMHPDRWYEIVDFLASGSAYSANPTALLAQARLLNLPPLIAQLEARIPGVRSTYVKGSNKFVASMTFCDVKAGCQSPEGMSLRFIDSFLYVWTLNIDAESMTFGPLPHKNLKKHADSIKLSVSIPLRYKELSSLERTESSADNFRAGPGTFRIFWDNFGNTLDEILGEELALAPDCLTVRLAYAFWDAQAAPLEQSDESAPPAVKN